MNRLAYHISHYKKSSLNALERHNYLNRSEKSHHSNPDIKTEFSKNNIVFRKPKQSLYQTIKKEIAIRVSGRIRSDSNWLTEAIIYPPKNIYNNKRDLIRYYQCVLQFHDQKFHPENVKSAVLHLDETTPHMHLDIVPITLDGRLSSKAFFSKNQLKELHTELAAFLKQNGFEIQRGNDTTGKPLKTKSIKQYKIDAEAEKQYLHNQILDLKKNYNQIARMYNQAIDDNEQLRKKNRKLAQNLLYERQRTR